MTTRILIADDHGVLRAGLRALLHGAIDMQVVAEASNGEEALQIAFQSHPDLVLLDISMPGIDGIEVTRRLKHALPNTQTLIMTMHEDTGLLREALRAGAAGYIIKRAVEGELISAIQVVRRGELYVHPALTRGLFEDLAPAQARTKIAEALTPREIEVLRLIAAGHSNQQIANDLIIAIGTVKKHINNIFGKLDVQSRTQAIGKAQALRLC